MFLRDVSDLDFTCRFASGFKARLHASARDSTTCTPILSRTAGLRPSRYLDTCCPSLSVRLFRSNNLINSVVYSCTDLCLLADSAEIGRTYVVHNLGEGSGLAATSSSCTKYAQGPCLLAAGLSATSS